MATPVIATGGWLWRSSDATRQGQRASIAACQMVPRPRQLASLLPRHQWCPLGSAARTTLPEQRACCANGSMIIAGIHIRHPRRRACWPATPASKSRSFGEMCAAPFGAHHPARVVLLMRSCTSLPRGTGFTNQRQRNWLCQGDDSKLLPAKETTASFCGLRVPRRRWQTADSSGSGPVTCE